MAISQRAALFLTAAVVWAVPQLAAAQADDTATLDELVVTARRREESLQEVPVAVTALSQTALQDQRLDTGQDLVRAVPNLNFVANSSSFTIRGIGVSVSGTAADSGVSVHQNNAPLVVSRLAGADFFDVERIEVLRGPQGTLFGRNATGGVVNAITAKPRPTFGASIMGELASYDSVRAQGYVNVPLNEMLAVRLAGTYLNRDGYVENVASGQDLDDRNLFSTRASLSFTPTSRLRANLIWEHFDEDDRRTGGAKVICAPDPGPSAVAGVPVSNPVVRNILSRGCLRTAIDDPASQAGTPNPIGTFGILNFLSGQLGLTTSGGLAQPGDFRKVSNDGVPYYKARSDIYQAIIDFDVADGLTLSSLTTYSDDHQRDLSGGGVLLTDFAVTPLTPGGQFNDPRFGPGGFTTDIGLNDNRAQQWSQELRLQSSFAGRINFNLGAIYVDLDRYTELVVGNRAFTLLSLSSNATGFPFPGQIYVDPNPTPNLEGHNYFVGRTPYRLKSWGFFGEVYADLAQSLRLTAGLRYSIDEKTQVIYPVQFFAPGRGFPSNLVTQETKFREPTGRLSLDWSPDLDLTDRTLVYASYSRGYKAGGFNPPDIVATSPTYAPEFVNAFEVGTKNVLMGSRLTLNLTGFYYDYKNYQISQVIGLTSTTTNVDATVKGLEFEGEFRPTPDLTFTAVAGYTDSSIKGGSSINVLNRTGGDPNLVEIRSLAGRCVGAATDFSKLIAAVNGGVVPANTVLGACPTAAAPNGPFASSNPAQNPLAALGIVVPTFAGVPVDLGGKRLPNTPELTLAVSAQYSRDLTADWRGTVRVDAYHQSYSYATIYNDFSDRFDAWSNVNLSLVLANDDQGLRIQGFIKNLFDDEAIVGVGTGTDQAGLVRVRNANDPRVVGLSVTKTFP